MAMCLSLSKALRSLNSSVVEVLGISLLHLLVWMASLVFLLVFILSHSRVQINLVEAGSYPGHEKVPHMRRASNHRDEDRSPPQHQPPEHPASVWQHRSRDRDQARIVSPQLRQVHGGVPVHNVSSWVRI
jgi:hypothetical protein